ncbi:ArsR/SmtB family transcription factor [Chloroflexota bacterium]
MEHKPSDLFRALGVDTRLRIIELLKDHGPLGVKKIAESVGVTPSAVSQHLRILKHAHLVQSERKGCCIPYSVDSAALENCQHHLSNVCSCGCTGTHGTGKHGFKEATLEDADLPALLKRKEEIENQLKIIQESISRIKTKQE